jgi:hypothetical protein
VPISIIGPTPAAVPDRTDVPQAKPKIVPRAKDEEENAWPSGDAHAEPGVKGLLGDIGEVGGNNFDGGGTPSNLTFVVGGFSGVFQVTVLGGNGGNGGKGGRGGDGGEGQDGGQKGDEGEDAPGGPGGDGGPGGQGGNAGSGGDANSFDLYVPNPNDVIGINTQITFSGGFRGRGGEGGVGGNGGLGGLKGSRPDGERGQQGNGGPIGPPGHDGDHNGGTGHLNIYVGVHP